MNARAATAMIEEIASHYAQIGRLVLIPPDSEECVGLPRIRVLGQVPPGLLYYHQSICIDPVVQSSTTGEMLRLQAVGRHGYYWIRRSQGSDLANIVAHIGSYDGQGEHLYAYVGLP